MEDWETAGARARPARPSDRVPLPAALRAATWLGAVLLIGAAVVFTTATFLGVHDDETEAHFLLRLALVVVSGIAIAVVGAVALLLRLVAGALVRR